MTGTPEAVWGFSPKSDSKASSVSRSGIQIGGEAFTSRFGRKAVRMIHTAGRARMAMTVTRNNGMTPNTQLRRAEMMIFSSNARYFFSRSRCQDKFTHRR